MNTQDALDKYIPLGKHFFVRFHSTKKLEHFVCSDEKTRARTIRRFLDNGYRQDSISYDNDEFYFLY